MITAGLVPSHDDSPVRLLGDIRHRYHAVPPWRPAYSHTVVNQDRISDLRLRLYPVDITDLSQDPGPDDVKRRNVDPDVAMWRSRLALACRAGDPDAIRDCRAALNLARAARLRADADAIAASVRDTTRLLIAGNGGTEEPIDPHNHQALYATTWERTDQFKREHGPATSWTDEDRTAWDALMSDLARCHVELGCGALGPCRMNVNRR